jgi:HTH-type transcriptional regulator / antitoxin HigA
MKIETIKSEDDYTRALERLKVIFHAPSNSKEGSEAETLSILIQNYEDEDYPKDLSDLENQNN